MANEQQYINPIIQSMIAARQFGLERERLQRQTEQQQEEQALREKQFAEFQKNQEFQHKLLTGQAENAAKQLQSQLELANLTKTQHAFELIKGGVQPTNLAKIAPELANITPEAIQEFDAARIRKLTEAKLGAEEKFDINKFNREQQGRIELQSRAQGWKVFNDELDRTHDIEMAGIKGKQAERIANLQGEWHLRAVNAAHKAGLGDAVGIANQLFDSVMTGDRALSTLNKDEKALFDNYGAAIGELNSVPSDQRKYASNLSSLSQVQTLTQRLEDLARNYSVDSPNSYDKGNNYIQGKNIPLIGGLTGTQGYVRKGSDLDNAQGTLKAEAGTLAEFYDHENRKSDADIVRQLAGAFDPALTVEQNLKKVREKQQNLDKVVTNVFGRMKPERVRDIMEKRGITGLPVPGEKTQTTPEYIRDKNGKLVLKQ